MQGMQAHASDMQEIGRGSCRLDRFRRPALIPQVQLFTMMWTVLLCCTTRVWVDTGIGIY